ncbi:MAG: HPF/RaiA family ribosome-associated protein [Candidatus Gracilibacteria bacterium]|jgi:ribosome-associated translation inhibitor RaiA
MEMNIFQKNLTQKEEEVFVGYLKQKTPAIQELLTKFSKDAALLKVTIEKFEKHDAYEVELCLVLPTKSMVAREASHKINKAIDLAKDRLVAQIKKHLALLREDRSHKDIIKEKAGRKVEVDEYEFVEQ